MADNPPVRRLRRDSEDGISSYGVALNRSRAGKRKEEWFLLKFLPKGRFFACQLWMFWVYLPSMPKWGNW